MIKIPLQPLPDQALTLTLGTQRAGIRVYSRGGRLFMDLAISGEPVFYGLACVLGSPVNFSEAFGVDGEFWWVDTVGESDPFYAGIDSRFSLIWISEEEAAE